MSTDTPSQNQEIAGLRHACRNSINQILGYTEILIDDAREMRDAADNLVPDLQRIQQAGSDLLPLIDGLVGLRNAGSVMERPQMPKGEAAGSQNSAPAFRAGDQPLDAGRILIVDDSLENRELLTRRLNALGHSCESVGDGEAALVRLREEPFDLVLLDVIMPGIDGYEALRRMKADEALRNVRVIMLSGVEEIDSIVRCLELGAADYLTKPFNSVLLSARVGASLRDKRMHDREEFLYREMELNFNRERRIAQALQGSLLQDIQEDSIPGVKIATLYKAALDEAQVGGDVYDAFALPGGRIALMVGDASGKGLAAATRIAQVKFALRAYAREYEHEPAAMVARLNELLCDVNSLSTGDDTFSFVVLALAVVDYAAGVVEFVCAGAEPPLLLKNCGEEVIVIDSTGMPLGVSPDAEYEVRRYDLGYEDTIVMCTDGITEAHSGQNFLGHDGMISLARSSDVEHCTNISAAASAIVDGARSFAGGNTHDDVCILLARRAALATEQNG